MHTIPNLNDLLLDVNNTQASYSYNQTIHELFEQRVKQHPQRPAVYLENTTISYDEFNKDANQYAWYLRQQGIEPNSIVGIAMDRSYAMLVGIFAILKSGGAYLPIDPSYPPARKQQIVNDSGMQFLLVNQSSYKLEFAANCRIINMQDNILAGADTDNLPKINSPTDLAYVIYTSGSTGIPKGVLIPHHALVNRIEWMQKQFPLQAHDVIFQKTHFSFDVSVWELLWWSIAGASVTLLPPGKEHNIILFTQLIKKFKVSVIHFVPSVLRIFLTYIEADFDLNKLISLKYIFASGEQLDTTTVQRFNQIFQNNEHPTLINLYGPTEATIDVSYFICDKKKHYQEIPIGKPINNIQLFVLDDNLAPLPIDCPGDLYISGVGLALGYLNNPKLTDSVFIKNPYIPDSLMYKTGDIAKWNHDKQLIFLGRKDNQVKLRGLRIELNEIQYHLLQHADIQDAIVLCITNDNLEQSLVAFIMLRSKVSTVNQNKLTEFLSQKLPQYMIPANFIFLEKFPLKNNGKIDQEKLRLNFINRQPSPVQAKLIN